MTTRLGAPNPVKTSCLQAFPGNVLDISAKNVPMGQLVGSDVEILSVTMQLKGAHIIGRNEVRPVKYGGDTPAILQICISRPRLEQLIGALASLRDEHPESAIVVSDEDLALVNPATEVTE